MRKTKLWVLVALFAMLSTSFALAGPKAVQANPLPVTVYKDADFTGTSQSFDVGSYNVDVLSSGVGNDDITSVRVALGYRVTLYKNADYSGESYVLRSDISNLGYFNDETSSLKVERIGGPVIAYADSPYGGAEQQFDVGQYNTNALNAGVGNDKMSAIRIRPGYKVTLYKDQNFQGASRVLTADKMYLDDFNDVVSSLKVETVSPIDSTSVAVPGNTYSNTAKRQILQTFAPRIWFAQGEVYFPSSVEYTFPYMDRYVNPSSGAYELKTKTALNPYNLKLPYFTGDLANAPIYAFWVEKEYDNVDLVYYQFSPYDLGKTVLGTEVGSHVGDWERITVRMAKFEDNNTRYMKPVQVLYGAHSFSTVYNWSEVNKINGTHPVAYSAFGSHGMWKDQGNHVYMNLVVVQLTDVANQGTAWDTWNNIQAFEYYPNQAKGIGLGNSFPAWLERNYWPWENGGAIYRFGNPGQGSYFGQPLLADGPVGPQEKSALRDDVVLD
ncbi:beta/gamma crystallin-related protein [Paenibacillus sp. GCM10012307]|uniref:Vps62-related protein n=1 Tax=Paenibacillus roseus TaxID=2798579 RepID=A0A934J2B4_9BACL|nr:beta/gamma crystallin-related protein [Paenibacillus roseus]MBJ6360153.1 Vps62-related protein [Paenibacillus roseus]